MQSNSRNYLPEPEPARRGVILAALATAAVLGGGGVAAFGFVRKSVAEMADSAATLPPFALAPLAGVTRNSKPAPAFASADFNGRMSLLNAWASWCPYCRGEHAALTRLAVRSGVPLYGLVIDDEAAHVEAFLQRHGNPFAALGVDTKGALTKALDVDGVPATFVIGPKGTVVASLYEPLTDANVASDIMPALTMKL